MSNLDNVFERNRVTKLGIDAMITNYLRLEKELYAAQADAERYRWLRARPVEDCTTPRIEVNVWTCNVSDEGISDSVNDGEVLAGKTLDAAIDRELVLKTGIPKTGIPVDDCNQGLRLMESKTLRLTSAYDEHEARERLRKTRLHLNAHINLAAALIKPKPWVGLTCEEMETLYYGNADSYGTERNFGRAVEAKLKEKNGG